MKKTAFIIGGHVTPALSILEILVERNWQIYYVGRKYALEGDEAVSQEFQILKRLNLPFLELTTGRLQRHITKHTFISLLKIPFGFWQSYRYLRKYKPDVVISFGGYVAFPIVLVAWMMQIPVVIHEQTLSPGLSNRMVARFATYICLGWKEIADHFVNKKKIYTGNPLRRALFQVKSSFDISRDKPLIYVTGGNLGAHSINILIENHLNTILENFCVVHQCGNSKMYNDFDRLIKRKHSLPDKLKRRYFPIEYIDEDHIGWVLHEAHILITRSGANIVSEIIALNKLALFIPLPWSGGNEQYNNAKYLVDRNAALMLAQRDVTEESLLSALHKLISQRHVFQEQLNLLKARVPHDAASQIVDVVESVV